MRRGGDGFSFSKLSVLVAFLMSMAQIFFYNEARASSFGCIDPLDLSKINVSDRQDLESRNSYFAGIGIRALANGDCFKAYLRGIIEAGDADRFSDFIEGKMPFLEQVFMVSEGGSLIDGIRIGRVI